jgi:hypothetical protein
MVGGTWIEHVTSSVSRNSHRAGIAVFLAKPPPYFRYCPLFPVWLLDGCSTAALARLAEVALLHGGVHGHSRPVEPRAAIPA